MSKVQGHEPKCRSSDKMVNRNIKLILEQMKGKKTDSLYEGVIPDGIRKIIRVSTGIFDYTEVKLKNLEEKLLKQIMDDAGLSYKKKAQEGDFACGCVRRVFERMYELEDTDAYTITKPRRFWFSTLIADVVNDSVRIYDTKGSIEIAAELLEQYLEKDSRKRAAEIERCL